MKQFFERFDRPSQPFMESYALWIITQTKYINIYLKNDDVPPGFFGWKRFVNIVLSTQKN